MGRHFGHPEAVEVGSWYESRAALRAAGVHAPLMAGISGSQDEGADSIVASGGYEDDRDHGDVIVYTGAGGNDPATGKQVADQEMKGGNLALARTCDEGLPLRVTRGAHEISDHAPADGFRYDGLYRVEGYWPARGQSGFQIFQYRLLAIPGESSWDGTPSASRAISFDSDEPPAGSMEPEKRAGLSQRTVRSSAVTRWVVDHLYQHVCQFCGDRLDLPTGPYAEGAHIRPLGSPHDGPDVVSNVLCLCPSCHVQFDKHGLTIDDGLRVRHWRDGDLGPVLLAKGHTLDQSYVEYRRSLSSWL